MNRLAGKVAIVTGGSAGIGRGVAKRFAREGAMVAIGSVDSDRELASVVDEIERDGGKAFAGRCDVSDRAQIGELVERTADTFGTVDVLVNGAAYMLPGRALDSSTLEHWDTSIRVGLDSVYHAMQLVFPYMRESGGKILNFTSLGGIRGVKGSGGYAAAKTGIIGLSRAAANDWAKYRINVNCIAPMAMSKSWSEYMATLPEGTDPFEALGTRRNAFGRPGDPENDIAPAAAFLCSSDADFVTGHILPVDGGLLDLE